MKYSNLLALPLCAAVFVACSSSHPATSTSATADAGSTAATQPASSMGGSMGGSMHGSSGHGGSATATFPSEEAAAAHCPSDTVVWLNTHSRVYHLKGSAEYGKTKHGGYACMAEADAAGDHKSKSE